MKTIKANVKTICGSSFLGVTINTTPSKLISLAESLNAKYFIQNNGEDKVNFDFSFETSEGFVFTVYDWKEYRPIGLDEEIVFHIGGFNEKECLIAKQELQNKLS